MVTLPEIPSERHFAHRIGWLRAAVLGANDGLLSVSSLMVGVSAAAVGSSTLVLTGIAGIVAGAMSMAAGEYVSVSSQADSEKSDLVRERRELAETPDLEQRELANIYVGRGLDEALAAEVAAALTAHDALEAHSRDELGISGATTARPVQAALASAASFVAGGIVPLLAVILAPAGLVIWVLVAVTIVTLAVLGAAGARAGGAPVGPGAMRVVIWGSLAMAITAAAGRLFGAAV